MFKTKNVTVVLAPAGAGKTTYLIERVEEDLKDYRPEELAFVSYTRKGAYEGKDRIARKFKLDMDQLDYFRTLHSLTYAEIKSDMKLFNAKFVDKFNDIFGASLGRQSTQESTSISDKMLATYDTLRAGKCDLYEDGATDGFTKQEFDRFVRAYESFKKKFNIIDYTDCLEIFVKRNKPVPIKVAYIDEAQDLTALQWQVCLVAFRDAEKIYIAGDDYQSIYTYAGARPQVLVQCANKYPTVKLEVSYRLPAKVYQLARGVTDMIGMKVEKDYVPFKEDIGTVERVHDYTIMASKIFLKRDETWLVLFRNNCHIPEFEKELHNLIIPYHTANGFCIGKTRLQLLKKFYNFRKKGFSDEVSKKNFMVRYGISDFNQDIVDTGLIENNDKYIIQTYIDKYGMDNLIKMADSKPTIFVATVHKVKGAEAQNVAFFLDCTKRVYCSLRRDLDVELRVLYVAITRAKDSLFLVRSRSKFGLDEIMDVIMEYAEL